MKASCWAGEYMQKKIFMAKIYMPFPLKYPPLANIVVDVKIRLPAVMSHQFG